MKKLSPNREKFANEYLIDMNATQAAIRAGYSEKNARKRGMLLLRNKDVKAYIDAKRSKTLAKLKITHEMITAEWAKIAFSTIAHMHNTWIEREDFENLTEEQKACIESIDTKVIKKEVDIMEDEPYIIDVEYVKIKLYDKTKALIELGKHTGYYEVDNKQKNAPGHQGPHKVIFEDYTEK